MDPFDAQLLQHFEAYKLPGWERMQYKAFRAWTNHKLSVRKWKPAEYLEDVFEDGFTLITLLEILSGKDVVPAGQKTTKNPSMRIQKIGNNNFNFVFMKKEGIRLENIGSEDIVDKNRKLILGLIWTLILHYQLAFAKGDSGAGPKKELLELVRGLLKPFNLPVDNFDNNWQDGRAFCALIAQHDPTLLDMTKINPNNAKENLEKAFAILEKTKDIPRMLDPNDVIAQKPDEKAVITYLAMILPVLTPVEKMPANSTLVSSPADIAPFEAGKQEPTFAIRSCHARSTLFEAELIGPDGKLPVVIRDNADKTYAIVPQRPYVTPGVYTLSAYFNKAHITQSPIRFTVLGGGPVRESSAGALFLPSKAGPSVASTLVVFPLTDTFRVPESSPHFVIEPRNANNQPIRTGGHRDQFTSSLTGPETIPTQIADRPDGTYAVNLLKPLTVPGRYKLSVQCNGTDISGSPFFFTVVVAAPAPAPKAAGPSAPHSNLQASPVADSYTAPNGLPQFNTQLRDPSSGPISGAANALSAAITGPEPIPCSVSEAYPAGNYNVVLGKPVTLPGRYKLTVQCNGADVNGSPLYFNVVKAGPSAPHSNLQASPVAESYTAPNGLPQFTTQLRDPSSAPVSGAANALSAAITGPEPIPCSVSEAYPAGNYNVVLGKPVTLPGRYKLTVQCNGADVNGSPLYFNVAAAPKAGPSAPHSTLQVTPVAESYIAPSGLPQFVVLLRNPARDPCPGQAAALSAAITGPEPIACSASDAGNGSYVIVLAKPITLPGRYKLEVLCNGEPVAQSPFYFVVVATPSPYTSEVSPVGGNAENTFVVPAAQPQFALQLRDLGKAPCDGTQGEPLSAQLIGPEAIAAAVLEARGAGVGAHHIVFAKPFTVAGRYQLDVYLGKAHVKGSPVFFNVVVQDDSRTLALAPRSAPTTGNLSELDELYLTLSSPVAAQQKAEEERRRQAEEERRAAAEADAKIAARKAEEARKAAEAQARAEEEERARARAALEELERTRARAQVEEEAAKARARAAAEEAERLRSKAAAEELELQRVRARAAEEEAARARARAAAEEAERARQRAEEDAARARARAVAEEGERARQRAAEDEAAKARARSAPPPMQDELEALIGDLAGSNKKPLTSAAAAPPTSNADANVYTINVKFQQFQPQDASRALDDPMVFTVLLQHQPLVQSLKEQLNAVPAPSGRPADVSAVKRNVYEVESEEDPLRNAIQLVFRTRTLDVPMLLRLLVGVVRAAKVVIDAAPADKRGQGVRAVQLFVLAVLRFIVTVSNLRYATDADFQAAVNPVSKEVTDSYRDLLNWLRSLYSTNTPVAPIAAPASPVATSPSPRLPVVVVMTVRQTFDNVLSTLPNSQSALITYNWRELDDVFRLVANILRQLHPRVTSADQVKLKATIQPVLDIGKAMRAHQATGNWVAFRDDKTKFIVALHALRDFLLELERRYSLSIDALIGASGSLSARSPAPISPAAQDNTRSVVGIDIGEVRRTLRRVMDELNAAADSTADNADRTMLREAARSLEGADEPIADALMFNDIGRLRIAIATYEGKLEAMQVMLRAFEQREAIRRDKARIRCAVCHNIIEGQYLKVGDKGFHKDCFRCTDCRSPIGELFYTDSMGRYFCPNHPPRD